MERVKIDDGTTWPDPTGDDFRTLHWRLLHAPESVDRGCLMEAAAVIDAYSNLILHPAFTLNVVTKKVRGIRKALKNKRSRLLKEGGIIDEN